MEVVSKVKVYDLEESIIASGYPMETDVTINNEEVTESDLKRAKNLCKACRLDNPAHGQYLTGIRVNFDLTFSIKAWTEAERYRFLEFVSSQSTMHRIARFDIENSYVPYVDSRMITVMRELVDTYNRTQSQEDYLKLLYSNPCGFRLTARMTTNYRCLANIYKQRKNHRLPEWKAFCKWIETLPYAKELIILESEDNT